MNDWIEWNGGECPVDKGCVFEVKWRNGIIVKSDRFGFDWHHSGSGYDIIAYRIVDETKQTNKYARSFTNRMKASETFDVYDVLVAFGVTCPMRQHAIKKLLAAGQRNGGKSELQDLQEALHSIEEAIKEKGE